MTGWALCCQPAGLGDAETPSSGGRARVFILELTLKENCLDLRNTRVIDVAAEMREYGVQVDVHDPWVDAADVQNEYGLALVTTLELEA